MTLAFDLQPAKSNQFIWSPSEFLHQMEYFTSDLTASLSDLNVSLKCNIYTFDVEADVFLCSKTVSQKLYASIRSEPFKIPEDDGNDLTLTFFNPDREGWLVKMGENDVCTAQTNLRRL